MSPAEFIAGLPKAELHIHLEASMEAALFLDLARRNGVALPWKNEEQLQAACNFADLQGFLDLYHDGYRVLVHAGDFHAVTRAYLARAHADKVLHAELFVAPQGHTARGVALPTLLAGVLGAMAEAEREDGISAGLILLVERHRSEQEALELLESAMPWRERILGFGLGGAERAHPPAKFAEFFRRCRERGFRVVAHAGEEGPASHVREAVELLQVQRVDHGNACADDPELVRLLAERQLPLTMCPLSNVKLHVVRSVAEHPLRRLLAAGVRVTINSDGPTYFGGHVNDNYLACQQALGLDRGELVTLARNSVLASFMAPARREAALAAIDAYAREHAEDAAPR